MHGEEPGLIGIHVEKRPRAVVSTSQHRGGAGIIVNAASNEWFCLKLRTALRH